MSLGAIIISITAGIDLFLWCLILNGIRAFHFDPRTKQFKILREVQKMENAAKNKKKLDALPLHERWSGNNRTRK